MSDGYELAALLELREQARDAAERALGDEVGKQRDARSTLDAARAELVEHDEELARRRLAHRAALESAFDLRTVGQFDDYVRAKELDRKGLERRIEDAEEELREADRRVKQARDDMIGAEQELSAVEKHRQNWKEEQAVVKQRRQADAMDEIAMTRWKKERG